MKTQKKTQKQFKQLKWADLYIFLDNKCNFHKDKKGEVVWTCYGDLRFLKQFCKEQGVSYARVKKICEDNGGFCDCEILFNVTDKIKDGECLK